MEKEPFLYFLHGMKYLPLLVGVLVAAIHFVVSLLLENEDYPSRGYIIWLLLNSPSFVLLYLTELDLIFQFPPAAFSSMLYGIAMGFIASQKTYLRITGIVIVCLILFLGSFLFMMFNLLSA